VFHACAGSNAVCNGTAVVQNGDQFSLIFGSPVPSYCQIELHLTQNGQNIGVTTASRPGC